LIYNDDTAYRVARSNRAMTPGKWSEPEIKTSACRYSRSIQLRFHAALAAGSIAAFLGTRPTWLLVQRYVMGTVLAGLAMKMAFEAKRA
jgi:hypothetical protein